MDSLDYTVVISAVALALSAIATIARVFNWFMQSDPAIMARMTRWMPLALLVICVPVLVVMIVQGQWSAAMLLGAAVLIVPTALRWRAVFEPFLATFNAFRPKPRPFDFDMKVWDPDMTRDPDTVRRAASLLEAYVSRSARFAVADSGRQIDDREADEMSEAEALEVLGLKRGADEATIRAAYRRLIALVHPDHSGSTYLSRKVSQAKETLLGISNRE